MEKEYYKKRSTKSLIKILEKRGLDTNGSREEIIQILLQDDDKLGDEEKHSNDEISDTESESSDDTSTDTKPENSNKMVEVSFNDVLQGLRSFTGDDHADISKWINIFEETALVMGWSAIQKLVFIRRMLKGTAAMIAQMANHTTYDALKETLLEEFATVRSSADLHLILSNFRRSQEKACWHT